MNYTIKRKNELITNKWAGGSTTELFIFPSISSYSGRDFEVRVSSATVESSPSAFTSLPKFHRVLMPITDSLKLVFEGHNEQEKQLFEICNEVNLKPFESIHFEGGWNTVSHGLCKDIGVMFSDNFTAKLLSVTEEKYDCENGFACVYALEDNVRIFADDTQISLNNGDFVVFETENTDSLLFERQNKNTAIIALLERK